MKKTKELNHLALFFVSIASSVAFIFTLGDLFLVIKGTQTQAVVTSVVQKNSGAYRVDLSYEDSDDNQQNLTINRRNNALPVYVVGKSLPVYYDQGNPKNVVVFSIFIFLFPLGYLLVFLWAIITGIKKFLKEKAEEDKKRADKLLGIVV